GSGSGGGGNVSSAVIADARSIRPKPYQVSAPTAPRSTDVIARTYRTSSGFVSPPATRTAAAPATCGQAIDVPDIDTYPPPRLVEGIDEPGAATSTVGPVLE